MAMANETQKYCLEKKTHKEVLTKLRHRIKKGLIELITNAYTKKIIPLILIGAITGCLHNPSDRIPYQEVLRNLGIPKRFENYKQGTKLPNRIIPLGGYLLYEYSYDIDDDGKSDVSEFYLVLEFNKNRIDPKIASHPLLYTFNINRNKYYDGPEEFLFDEAMDGLNGNEKWLNDKKIIDTL